MYQSHNIIYKYASDLWANLRNSLTFIWVRFIHMGEIYRQLNQCHIYYIWGRYTNKAFISVFDILGTPYLDTFPSVLSLDNDYSKWGVGSRLMYKCLSTGTGCLRFFGQDMHVAAGNQSVVPVCRIFCCTLIDYTPTSSNRDANGTMPLINSFLHWQIWKKAVLTFRANLKKAVFVMYYISRPTLLVES